MEENGPFNVGSILRITTCHDESYRGEVMAFDFNSRLVILKTNVPNKHNTADVRVINLDFAKDVEVLKENESTTLPPLNALNLQRIHQRFRTNLEDKKKQAAYVGVNVSSEGQKLFYYITRTLKNQADQHGLVLKEQAGFQKGIEDVRWEGQNIVVLDDLRISPPYGVENMHLINPNSKSLGHIRKIVDKFFVELAAERGKSDTAQASCSPSTSPSSNSNSS